MSRQGSVRRDADTKLWCFVVDMTPPGAPERKQIRRRGFKTKADGVLGSSISTRAPWAPCAATGPASTKSAC
jgi:hypothetical protein